MDLPLLIELPDATWVCPTEIVGVRLLGDACGFQLQKRNNTVQTVFCPDAENRMQDVIEAINITRR